MRGTPLDTWCASKPTFVVLCQGWQSSSTLGLLSDLRTHSTAVHRCLCNLRCAHWYFNYYIFFMVWIFTDACISTIWTLLQQVKFRKICYLTSTVSGREMLFIPYCWPIFRNVLSGSQQHSLELLLSTTTIDFPCTHQAVMEQLTPVFPVNW